MALEPRTQAEVEDRRGRGGRAVGRAIHTARAPVGRAALLLVLAASCAPTPGQKLQSDVASMQKEATPKTLIERGRAFGSVGDFTRAEEYFASALDQGADAREVLPLLMDVCIRTGRFRSAIQYGEDHLRKHPNDHQTRVMVGALYAGLNEGPQAKLQLDPVAREPDARPALRAQAHYLLAVVARDDLRDVVSTDEHFREYLRLEPNGQHVEEAKAALLTRVVAEPEGTDAGVMPRRIEKDGG